MATLTREELWRELKAGKVGPLYLLFGPEDYLRSRGVTLDVRDNADCTAMMQAFIADRPELWNEDIGR